MLRKGQPAAATDWLGSLPFASQNDYGMAISNVLAGWNLRSQTETAEWLQYASLEPSIKANLLKAMP